MPPEHATPLREPGWYRLTAAGWEHVTDDEARELTDAGHGMDLVLVETVAEEVPLW